MPLREAEVVVGNVAYFDHEVLLQEPDIDRDDDQLDRSGPFVCVQVKDMHSVWCAITTEPNPKRLSIETAWRIGGAPGWRSHPQYLNDGLSTYLGPTEAFLRAAAGEKPFKPYSRPAISNDGMAAILEEIDKQGGPLLD